MNMLDVMTKDLFTIHEKDSLANALDMMTEAKIHHLIVVSASGKLLGILSDRDCKVAMRSPFSEGDPKRFTDLLPVSYVMTSLPQCISPHVSVGEAAQVMLNYQIHALPIVHDDVLIGIVTSTDLLSLLVGQGL
jgi:CBS domain-containing membrane protein